MTVLEYHVKAEVWSAMAEGRTEIEAGRVNQKRRTRAALVAAGKALMAQGRTPTVAEAAEAALVSRTTAYRYFPTQESLLLELATDVDVDHIEELVASPMEPGDAPARVLQVIEELNRSVLAEEVRYRTLVRIYLDEWLAATAAGDEAPHVRQGRRRRWLADSLAPIADTVSAPELDRLLAALSLLTGAEAVTVLHDVCALDDEDALAVTRWAAGVLLDASVTGNGAVAEVEP